VIAGTIVRQQRTGGDLDAVEPQLTAGFLQLRAAVLEGEPAVVVVDDADLLGQGDPADAAVATGLLGLVRALAMEGARDGWRVNAVSCRGEDPDLDDTVSGVLAMRALSGQLIRLGTAHIGKVIP
jgi:NAD(P)-dependent dehydrogenase (short-subunit alcohol dehydrogenase family)